MEYQKLNLPIIFLTTSLVSPSEASLVISIYIIIVLPSTMMTNPTPKRILLVDMSGQSLHMVPLPERLYRLGPDPPMHVAQRRQRAG